MKLLTMSIVEMLFSAASNLLSIYVAFRLVRVAVPRKSRVSIEPLLIYFSVWFINWIARYFLNNTILTSLSLILGMLFAVQILYEGSFLRKMISVALAFAAGNGFENIVWIVLSRKNLHMYFSLGCLISSFFIMVIVLVLEKYTDLKKSKYMSIGSYANILIIILGSIVLGEILISVGNSDEMMVMLGLSLICLLDVSTYYIYDKVSESYLQKFEKKIAKQKEEMYRNQLDIMQRSEKNIRALNHDMKNHMLMIQSFIDNGQYDKALQYTQNISNFLPVPGQYVSTGNQEVDVILNYKLAEAKGLGSNIETQIQIPNIPFMEAVDLNVMLGNLMDNAVEALEKTDERYLYVGMKYRQGILMIKITNSYNGTLVKKGEKLVTQKDDVHSHGIGLTNVDEIITKYSGSREIDADERLFTVKIILYVDINDV